MSVTPRGERSYDIYSRLLNDRIIFPGLGDLAEDAVKLQLDHLANPPDLKP